MAHSTTCVCEPRNARLCCDSTCCSLERGLNGNHLVELNIPAAPPPQQPQARPWRPTLVARISHIAGFPTAFCEASINGVIVFLACGTLLSPVLMLLWTCCAIETTLLLTRSASAGGGVSGVVTRRSACCTWHTRVEGVAEVKANGSEGEGPDPVSVHFSSGAGKLEISEGLVAGLEGPVNDWIRSGGGGACSVTNPAHGQGRAAGSSLGNV